MCVTMTIYTVEERTIKKYTIAQAVDQARAVLASKHSIREMCVDTIQRIPRDKMITLKEMSVYVEGLILDTLYWEGRF